MNDADASIPIQAEPVATGSAPVFPLTEIGKKSGGEWTLTLLPSHLAIADAPGAQPYVILREQIMKTVVIMESTRALILRQPRELMFKLTPEGLAALADWVGKSFLASFYLKRRYAWVSVWALLWVGGSLILLISPPRDGAPPFQLFNLLLGVALLVASALARWRPHPSLFLVDSLWFGTVAVQLTISITQGKSKGWYLLVALLAWSAITGFRHFMRFRGTKLVALPK